MNADSSRLKRLSGIVALALAAAVAAESAVPADEVMTKTTRAQPTEEVLVTALRIRTESFPATILQWAVAGEGTLIPDERTVKHVHNALPITEHQVESLRDNAKLLGLPEFVAE